jgi:hypothetical protein
MAVKILISVILFFGFYLKPNRKEVSSISSYIPLKNSAFSISENMRFDFTAKRINNYGESIEVVGSLINENADTVYFLSTTCDGEQYSLQFDTTQFELTPFLLCNASFPKVIEIPPHGHYDFTVHFRADSHETKIKLGFDFYSVDKSFRIINQNWRGITIFNRSKEQQNILWAEEKTIR